MQKNRILSVRLSNIKNVEEGYAEFPEKRKINNGDLEDNSAGILGFYGPNGSGKTTVVDAFQLLKEFSLDRPLYSLGEEQKRIKSSFDYLLTLGKEKGSVEFEFLIFAKETPYKVNYSFDIVRNGSFVSIAAEHLLVSRFYPEAKTPFKYPFAPLDVDFSNNMIAHLYDGVKHRGSTKTVLPSQGTTEYDTMLRLSTVKGICIVRGTSFVFSNENIQYLRQHSNADVRAVGEVLRELKQQLGYRLFVFPGVLVARSRLGESAQFGICYDPKNKEEVHGLFYRFDKPFLIPENLLFAYEQTIDGVNRFISSFVDGFELGLEIKEKQVSSNGSASLRINIYRFVNGEQLPLSQESAGLKQLINLAMGFVYVYGDSCGWLVVDELDAGVFEMLWADIIEAQSKEGKGQILFTAHNLAPLECISPSSIVFTTSNPRNRYVTFSGITKKTNNLRHLYLRALRLGWEGDDLSNGFDRQDIGAALWDANQINCRNDSGAEA